MSRNIEIYRDLPVIANNVTGDGSFADQQSDKLDPTDHQIAFPNGFFRSLTILSRRGDRKYRSAWVRRLTETI